MIEDSFRFPLRGEDTLRTLLVGGVLSLFGFLVVPAIVVQGYLVSVLGAAIRGDAEPPEFEDWADLLLDGIKAVVVQLVYVALPFIVLFFALVFTAFGMGDEAPGGGLATGIGLFGGLLFVVAILLFVAVGYLVPAALANFARYDDLSAAFDLETVTRVALTADYFVAVLVAAVVGFVVGLISIPLMIVLVGFAVQFYGQVVVFHVIGEGFADARGIDGGRPRTRRL